MTGAATGQIPAFSVWAPRAGAVDLVWRPSDGLGESDWSDMMREPMRRGSGGWWETALPTGGRAAYGMDRVGVDYGFVLDGAWPPLPDPRSAWQPLGVHGPSRTFDACGFEWTDHEWRGPRSGRGVLGGLVYELHIGTFTAEGTFDAAIDRLEQLVELGVDVVEVMPVAAFPGRWGWGYDGVDLFAVHDAYGGPRAFQRFVDVCHGRGLGVCLDVVHNHFGPVGNYLTRFGPYFTEAHETPWGPAVNFDSRGSSEVRAFVLDNATHWFRDFHVDALRLDAVHELRDEGPQHVLAELADEVARLSLELARPLDLIAESDLNDVCMIAPTATGGHGMTAQWADDVHHSLHVVLTGETFGYYADFGGGSLTLPEAGPLGVFEHVATRGFLHDGRWSTFRRRRWGAEVDRESTDARRLLAYLQTHDQVGNRAQGDRIHAGISEGRHAAGAAFVLLGPWTPMVFMGEEWAASTPWQFFTDFEDEAVAAAIRAGRRSEFATHGWSASEVPDPQSPATRDRSVLDWGELSEWRHARIMQWYAALADRRRTLGIGREEIRLRDVSVTFDEVGQWVTLTHSGIRVVVNLSASVAVVPLVEPTELLLDWNEGSNSRAQWCAGGIRLAGESVAVVTEPSGRR